MATEDSSKGNNVDKTTNHEPDANPKPDNPSEALLTLSESPAICLFEVAKNSAAGALMGSIFGYGSGLYKKKGIKGSFAAAGSSAKSFAVFSGIQSSIVGFLKKLRSKDDVVNAGIAGCWTGIALNFPDAPRSLLRSCIAVGVFSFIMEDLNRRHRTRHVQEPRSVSLPLSLPLPEEVKGAFSSFCNSLAEHKKSKSPTSPP